MADHLPADRAPKYTGLLPKWYARTAGTTAQYGLCLLVAQREELAKLIDQYEVISFDIFDTLLMRRVLEPQDVFRLVEYTLRIDFWT